VPTVANVDSAQYLCETWKSRYNRLPDALILENCQKVGGHFTQCEQINVPGFSVGWVIAQVREYLAEKMGVSIPLIVTGGISDRTNIDQMLAMGADGVQIGTRFITTIECDAHQDYKQRHLQAHPEDVVTVPSPVGKPSRALRNPFTEQIMADSSPERRCIANCLDICLFRDKGKTYCLLNALAQAARGDIENGLMFSGTNVSQNQHLISVAELMADLTTKV
jgi:NAD(P)H-dependent flavin oxidoreductase YrpB (nitropropane dioxygenase family)